MNTFLGASHLLDRAMIDEALIADADILYLEGYLWDPPLSRAAMRRAIDVARAAGRKVAFTLSAAFIINRHAAAFRPLIPAGLFHKLARASCRDPECHYLYLPAVTLPLNKHHP